MPFVRLALASALVVLSGCAAPDLGSVLTPPSARPAPPNPMIRPTPPFGTRVPGAPSPAARPTQPQNDIPPLTTGTEGYSGPPRWGFDNPFAQDIARLRVFVSDFGKQSERTSGDPAVLLKRYTLNLERVSVMDFLDIKRNHSVKGEMLDCEYKREALTDAERARADLNFRPEFMKVFYWKPKARRALSEDVLQFYRRKSDHIADVELGSCPPDLAAALEAGFGPQAWTMTRAAIGARDTRIAGEIERGATNAEPRDDWDKDPKLVSREEFNRLRATIEASLTELESYGERLTLDVYGKARHQVLEPSMAKLAASALVQSRSIPKGPKGRAAFQKWDDEAGHVVVKLAVRLHTIARAGANPSRGGFNPGKVFIDVPPLFLEIYAEQIKDKGALDSAYVDKMVASIAKYKEANNTTAEPTSAYLTSHTVLVMRPRQSLLYRTLSDAVQVVQKIGEARARNQQYLREMSIEIRETRQAFWACYAKRCDQGGILFHRLSTLFYGLDRHRAGVAMYEGWIEDPSRRTKRGSFGAQEWNKLIGVDMEADTKYPGACDAVYEEFLQKFWKMGTFEGTVRVIKSPKIMQEAFDSDEYLALQQCRDRMEFIMRPRG